MEMGKRFKGYLGGRNSRAWKLLDMGKKGEFCGDCPRSGKTGYFTGQGLERSRKTSRSQSAV